jgi:hypothetical protein
MITSALIAQCRREFQDNPKSSYVQKMGDGSSTLFNAGKFPIIEKSFYVTLATSGKTSGTVYSLNLDNGDLNWLSGKPGANQIVAMNFQYANWRDQSWLEAINQAVDVLNGKGFFRQTVRDMTAITISANTRLITAPSGTIEVYEFLESDNGTMSGNWRTPSVNWSWQQDAGKIVLGQFPTANNKAAISYLRNMKKYSTTSATLDVKDDWIEMLKKYAGGMYYRSMAAKIATQGNANIDEGHFSFTNLRTQANDLFTDFENIAKAKKPTRPAVGIGYALDTGGPA